MLLSDRPRTPRRSNFIPMSSVRQKQRKSGGDLAQRPLHHGQEFDRVRTALSFLEATYGAFRRGKREETLTFMLNLWNTWNITS